MIDGIFVSVQCVQEGARRRPVASAEDARRGLIVLPCPLCPRTFGAFPAELEPALLPHISESCVISHARKLCVLKGSAGYPSAAVWIP